MKVLDLFCGMGGWSEPFIDDGDDVWGIDIEDRGYPGKLIQEDIRNLDGYGFSDMDLIIGSPPCVDFSTAGQSNKARADRKTWPMPERGLKLIIDFNRFIREAKPQFWAMENVRRAEKFYFAPPIWHFKVSILGWRTLWGNLPIPHPSPEFIFKNRFLERDYTKLGFEKASAFKAKIPYSIARFVADSVKAKIITYKPEVKMAKPE